MEVGIYTFARHHGRDIEKCGSSVIRGLWYDRNWPEAELYREGKKYDAIIFQKVWWEEIYEKYDGIKILDLCDPEWIQSDWPIKKISTLVDAIVVSSEGLYEGLKKIIDPEDCELIWIDDRVDMDFIGELKKEHEGPAKKIGWYGYSGNGQAALPQVLHFLPRHELELKIISDKEITFAGYESLITNVEHSWSSILFELLSCDIILNPPLLSPYARFKSKNKTYLAWALGIPVAHNAEELERFLDADTRAEEGDRVYKLVREDYGVEKSITEYKELIEKLWKNKK